MRSRIIERVIRSSAGVSSPGSSKSPSSPQHPTRAFTQRPSIVVAGVTTISSTIRPNSFRSDQSILNPRSMAKSSLAAIELNRRPSPIISKSAPPVSVGVRPEPKRTLAKKARHGVKIASSIVSTQDERKIWRRRQHRFGYVEFALSLSRYF